MAKRTILSYPDKRLHTVAKPVQGVDARIKTLVADMIETMYEANGIGLAATQVDVHERLVVIDISEERNEPLVLINPEIVWASEEKVLNEEGCLSVPGIYDGVERATAVRVTALDANGEPQTIEAEGLLAVCIQHELDHLLGKVFVEYLSPSSAIASRASCSSSSAKTRSSNNGKDGGERRRPRLARRAACCGAGVGGLCGRADADRAGHLKADALQQLGAPTAAYPLSGGGERLQYSRAPAGFEVNNVDLDAGGRVVSIRQELDDRLFDRTIQPGVGVWREADVLRIYGRPFEITRVSSFDGVIWSWRYKMMNAPRLLYIYVDPAGVVQRYHTGDDLMRDLFDRM